MRAELAARLAALEAAVAEARTHWGPLALVGSMVLDTERRPLTVLLGNAHHAAGALAVIDWQRAPLAEVFFGLDEGEDYELQLEDRLVRGRLVQRALLRVEHGALLEAWCAAGHAVRTDAGGWEERAAPVETIAPRPPSARLPYRSPLEVQLDPAQRRAVDLPADRHLLLLGEAGFGKTTVALHRLVALKRRHEAAREARGGPAFRGAVVVPTEGLKRLSELMLARHGDADLSVFTFDAWARRAAHAAFRGLPRRESVDATSRVIALKRHGALRAALPAFVQGRLRAHTSRRDLLHLFGDKAWLEQVVAASGGRLHAAAVAEVAEHTHVQFSDTTEREYAHVTDAGRLAAVDGRTLDAGTPMEDAGTLDVEDYPVLFELERLRRAHARQPPSPTGDWHALVVDEAQELAPLELAMLARALAPGGCLIVAGDAAQQVDETADFAGWPRVMEDLGRASFERVVLEVNYRCPDEVTALARRVAQLPATPAPDGGRITWVQRAHPAHALAWLVGALREVVGADPAASICVVCRSAERARAVARTLGFGLEVHLALGGDFHFRPGVAVTPVEEVKGLEFDLVVLPDADEGTWPATAEGRRALYVALTRASHRLVLVAGGRFSPLLAAGRAP